MSINLSALEQALHVFDFGSFRKAAELIGVQPSAVSRSIRGLEEAIGVSLFHRQVQGATPTRAGERLLPRIRRLVDELRLIARAGHLAGEGREGVLCVGIVASIAGGGTRDLLATFLRQHPDIQFNVIEGSPRDHLSEVRALTMDAAIVVGRPPSPGCVAEMLWFEPIMVALPEAHPLARAQAVMWPHLVAERFLVSRMDPGPEIQDYVVQHLATLGHHPIVEPRTVGRDGLMALVGLSQGITLVCGAEAAVSYPGVVFRPLKDEPLPFSLVWSERNDNPILRRFMSLARRWSRGRVSYARNQPNDAPSQTPDPLP